jgi:hypothetical protein
MTPEEVLKDPDLVAHVVEAIGAVEWGAMRSERAKDAGRQLYRPHAEAVVKMLRERAGLHGDV